MADETHSSTIERLKSLAETLSLASVDGATYTPTLVTEGIFVKGSRNGVSADRLIYWTEFEKNADTDYGGICVNLIGGYLRT